VLYGLFCLDTGSEIEKIVNETSEITTKIVNKHHKLASGGVDAHQRQDLLSFANSGGYTKKTVGMAENIIKRSNVDKKWSNYL